jgi:hypothetical protein
MTLVIYYQIVTYIGSLRIYGKKKNNKFTKVIQKHIPCIILPNHFCKKLFQIVFLFFKLIFVKFPFKIFLYKI